MTRDEFVRLVGGKLVHCTLRENLPGIEARGLLRPVTLASLANVDPKSLVLREHDVVLDIRRYRAHLNHQKPLRAGRKHESEFLDGHTLDSWSEQMNRRVFLWPRRKGVGFLKSLFDRGAPMSLWLDAGRMFDRMAGHLDLAPISTGDATRRPVKRGDWIYVKVSADVEDFRQNRIRRGLATAADTVQEVSVRADIPPQFLAEMRAP
jgi:hypothetical protein